MKTRCIGVLSALLICGILSSHAQEQKYRVEVVSPKELKRTSHTLRITVQQLTNARAALKEATDLALRLDPPVPESYDSIVRLWTRIDRKKSNGVLLDMIAQLTRASRSAETLESWQLYTTRAKGLLMLLNATDPDRAAQLAELWPRPPSEPGRDGSQVMSQFQKDIASDLVNQLIYSEPERLYEQLQQPEMAGVIPFAVRSQVARMLIEQKQKEKARALLDQAVTEFGQNPPDPSKSYESIGFLRDLARIYPEKFLEAFKAYQQALELQAATKDNSFVAKVGDGSVPLSAAESAALNLLRGPSLPPGLATDLLDSLPELQAKFEPYGGIDRALSPGLLSENSPVVTYPAGSPPPKTPPPSSPSPVLNSSQLLRELRGKAESEPAYVRRRLAEVYQKKEDFSSLVNLAQMANSSDPELASLALEAAHGLLTLFDKLPEQSNALVNLVNIMYRCEGEVDPGLIREGYGLVQQMRAEEEEKEKVEPAMDRARGLRASDNLEVSLISMNALDDFDAAMKVARAMEEAAVRVQAMFRVAQSLVSNY